MRAKKFICEESFSFENLKKNRQTGTQIIPIGKALVIKKYPQIKPSINIIIIGFEKVIYFSNNNIIKKMLIF